MQQIARSIALAFNNLPRPHRVILGSLTVVTLAVAVWRPQPHVAVYSRPSYFDELGDFIDNIKDAGRRYSLQIPAASEPLDQPEVEVELPEDEIDVKTANAGKHDYEYVVTSGDTLASILNQFGIDTSDINHLLLKRDEFNSLKEGQQLAWKTNEQGLLEELTWEVSRRETRTYIRLPNGEFKVQREWLKGEWKNVLLSGEVGGSFVSSARNAGLTTAEINAVIRALQWQMDFRKLRKGDKFVVLMSREMVKNKREQSQLLGVRLRSGGKDYYAFRAEDGKFYDRNGSGLAKGFLRLPTARQYRISSNFNPHRVNPVTRRVAPHKGVDFAMPVGTPVMAVGDGEVVVARRSGAAGNYIAIRHGRQYMTRYMHLRKILVKEGQKVKRGERIALSGNTGRSTGPHLHFELWVNNQAVNPLKAKLPRTEGLTGKERNAYLANVRQLLPQLKFN